MRIIATRMTRYAGLFGLAATLALPAQAQAPMLKEFEWPREAVFCGLSRAETVQDRNAAGKYFFITALLNDPQVAIERGYAQLGAEVEELDFVDRNASGSTEVRRYRTKAAPQAEITVNVKAEKAEKQTVFVGTVTARRGAEEFSVAVRGSCR